ncbi:MAG: hypothetical protein QM742_14980 [Aquabacterium sp.]
MKKPFQSMLGALALALPTLAAQAAPIDFTFSGVADFELEDGRTLEDAAFTVRTTADTVNLQKFFFEEFDVLQYTDLTASLSVAGLGDGQFTDRVGVFANPAVQSVGFQAPVSWLPFKQVFSIADLFALMHPTVEGFDMASDFKLDEAQVYDPQQWFIIPTSFGKLSATGFQSLTMQVTTSPVPEPLNAALFGLGGIALIGLMGVRRAQGGAMGAAPLVR